MEERGEFQKIAAANRDRRPMSRFRTEKIKFIQERCRGKRVLDVGCVEHTLEATERPQWLHARIVEVAESAVGLDYEKEAVEELNRRGWHMIAADAQDFDIRDRFPGGFDVIVASEIVEHLVNPGGFFLSLKKHLAPGGGVILSTPHIRSCVFCRGRDAGRGKNQRRPHDDVFQEKPGPLAGQVRVGPAGIPLFEPNGTVENRVVGEGGLRSMVGVPVCGRIRPSVAFP